MIKLYAGIFLVLIFISSLTAQLSLTTLLEYQLGNLPETKPDDMSTLYSQFNLDYSAGLRYEDFQSAHKNNTYNQLAQRYFEWQQGAFRARLGNFYTTLGRGLILRGFELPNVIFEQRQFRKRYGYYRDIDGLLVEAKWEKFEISLLKGKPLNNSFPPRTSNIESRYGNIEGGQIRFRPVNWIMVGDAYAHTDFKEQPGYSFNSLFGQLSFGQLLKKAGYNKISLKLYAEHARRNSFFNDFFNINKINPHATYYALNFSYKRLGISAEYKDYLHFENLINLPPILYMEHSYYLLNRSTHELLSDNEKGYQFEVTFRPVNSLFILANTSFAKNEFFQNEFEFADRMLETTIYWTSNITSKSFYNWSKDEIKGETDRKTGGVNIDWNFFRNYALSLDLQHQSIKNIFYPTDLNPIKNTFMAWTLSGAPKYSLSFSWDRSTDPVETDKKETSRIIEQNPKNWFGFSGSVQLNMSHDIQLFYGARRGGLLCLSGTCYEVLPFKGLELRWIGHF